MLVNYFLVIIITCRSEGILLNPSNLRSMRLHLNTKTVIKAVPDV